MIQARQELSRATRTRGSPTMNVRSQVSMVFHLDKCIGCHTCTIACKNIWTDRKGAEYMWWNNVETKPGTGYPTQWEDQEKYSGGWEVNGRQAGAEAPRAKGASSSTSFTTRTCPAWTTTTSRGLTTTRTCSTRRKAPTSRRRGPISMVTGEPIEIKAGPNWDDDLGGSPVYAAERSEPRRPHRRTAAAAFSHRAAGVLLLPRICNHCLNPSCVASCPSGAMYKRGEDGIVLMDQDGCRGWRIVRRRLPLQEDLFQLVHRASRRSASSAIRGWRPARRRPASTPASGASAIWACCSTTPTASRKWRSAPTKNWSRRSAR